MRKILLSIAFCLSSFQVYALDESSYLTYNVNALEFGTGDQLNIKLRSNLECVDILMGQIPVHTQCSLPFDFMIVPSDITKGETGTVTVSLIGYDSERTQEKIETFEIKIVN